MGSKLTKAQARLLAKFASYPPGSRMYLESVDRGYNAMPIFRARLQSSCCPTCGQYRDTEPVSFDCVVALHELGMIKERLRGTEIFYNDDITDAGRKALEQSQ